MLGSWILFVGFIVQDTWPNDCTTQLGCDCDVVDRRKVGATSFVHIVQIKVDSYNSWSTLPLLVYSDVVMVNIVAAKSPISFS